MKTSLILAVNKMAEEKPIIPIWDQIRNKFASENFIVMQEVRDDAGFNASRSADGIAINTWPSRGLEVNGIELKASRSDWLNELKNPKKAEAIFQFCDRFWLVTTSDTVAKKEEIPATWGWIASNGQRLKVIVEAPKLKPVDLSRGIVVSMLKRCTKGMISPHEFDEAVKVATKNKREFDEYHLKQLQEKLDHANNVIKEFEEAAGIQISNRYEWQHTPKKVGAAIKAYISDGPDFHMKNLEGLEKSSFQIHQKISNILNELRDGRGSVVHVESGEQPEGQSGEDNAS